jgi:hypothetical protein
MDDFMKGAEPKAWHPTTKQEAIDVAGAEASARANAGGGATPRQRNAYVLRRATELQKEVRGGIGNTKVLRPAYPRQVAERMAGDEYDRVVAGLSTENGSGSSSDPGGDITLAPQGTPTRRAVPDQEAYNELLAGGQGHAPMTDEEIAARYDVPNSIKRKATRRK